MGELTGYVLCLDRAISMAIIPRQPVTACTHHGLGLYKGMYYKVISGCKIGTEI